MLKSKNLSKSKVDWRHAPDISERVARLISLVSIDWVDPDRIYCFRSTGSRARAIARIWGLQKVWQQALDTSPAYCLEVLSESFDNLSPEKQDEVLLHEIAHIPKTFSGALLPHTMHGKGSFHSKLGQLITLYKKRV